MVIRASATFDYRVVLEANEEGWHGPAEARVTGRPGLVGVAPNVKISRHQLVLQRTDDAAAYEPDYYGIRGTPMQVTFAIGDFLQMYFQAGDCLRLTRGPYGVLGLQLFREDSLIVALGSCGRQLDGLTITPDPRAVDIESLERPAPHPANLYIRFHHEGNHQDVVENGHARMPPWLVAVRRVPRIWAEEQIGVVRDVDIDPGVLQAAIGECSEALVKIAYGS